jgi:hypothetical protein
MNYVTNPRSNRPVRIGSKTWKQLVTDKLIEGNLTPLFESTDKTELKVAKKIMQRQDLGPRKKVIISNDKIVKANKTITGGELTKHTAQSAGSVFKKIRTGEIPIPEDMNDDELAIYLEKCVLAEVVGGSHKIEKPKRYRSPNKPKFQAIQPPTPTTTDVETTEVESDDEETDESETE